MTAAAERLALKLVVGLGCVMLLALLVQDRNRWKQKSAHYAALLSGERAAHEASLANVRAAAAQARLDDAANAARVRAAQDAINERTLHDFETRMAAARAAGERLRRGSQAAAAGAGGGGTAPVPGLPASPGGAAQAAGEDRLPDADRLIATEQAIQLDELILWVREQAGVERSGD